MQKVLLKEFETSFKKTFYQVQSPEFILLLLLFSEKFCKIKKFL